MSTHTLGARSSEFPATALPSGLSSGPAYHSRLDNTRAEVDYSDFDERSVLQTVFATPIPNRLDRAKLESAGRTRRQQNRFRSCPRRCRVRTGRGGALARDRASDAAGCAVAPVRARSGVLAGFGTAIRP